MGVLFEIIKNSEVMKVGGKGVKHRKWTYRDRQELKKLYLEGTSKVKLAKKYRVSATTISNRLKELGIN